MPTHRVLFFAEPATLAHVARPVVLAQTLDRTRYDVVIATGPDFRALAEGAGVAVRELACIGTGAYLAAVAAGRPVYPYAVLARYVEEDLRLIAAERPDVVVGDFRLSLAVSARIARVPYVAISNAYWSPYATPRYAVPVHAATRLLGVGVCTRVFDLLRPAIFAQHAWPMHRLRRRHGMPSLGFDLRRVFTEGDVTLFADVPELVPVSPTQPEARYRYIGPVVWSPAAPLPSEFAAAGRGDPGWVYVALGSSGDERLLETLVAGVLAAGRRAIVAARDRGRLGRFGADVVVAPMLPGSAVAGRSDLVICNGGSPGTHQALLAGTPTLGIPANLDQLLNMEYLVRTGAAGTVRADQVSPQAVGRALAALLERDGARAAARQVQRWLQARPAADHFPNAIASVVDDATTS